MFDCDVLVLGGGPAGLAAAIAASRAGLNVMLADALQPPVDKACGEGLMPDSLAAASKLGVDIPASAGYRFKGIRFQGCGHSVAGEFPNGSGLGVRRTLLQTILMDVAASEGVELVWRSPATGVEPYKVFFAQKQIRARWIIGADGSQSSVRHWAGMQSFRRNSQRFSYRRHYRVAPWSDYLEIYWGRGCQFYVTPVNANEICLVLMTRNQHQRVADALPQFPLLAERLRDVEPVTPERGAIAAIRELRRVTREHVALVGDASGTVDPITGEGLCLAFKQAVALAHALVAGDLALYEETHRRIAVRPRFMADSMLLMDRSALLQKRTMAAFENHPRLFSNLLALHVGELSPVRFAATTAALGLAVATA